MLVIEVPASTPKLAAVPRLTATTGGGGGGKVAVTVKLVLPVLLPDAALIVTVPVLKPVARPVALMVAMTLLLDVQLAELEISVVLLSEKVAVATNC